MQRGKVMDRHLKEKKESIILVLQTLLNLSKGGKNAEKGWLLSEEVDVVINTAIELAARGFPLSYI